MKRFITVFSIFILFILLVSLMEGCAETKTETKTNDTSAAFPISLGTFYIHITNVSSTDVFCELKVLVLDKDTSNLIVYKEEVTNTSEWSGPGYNEDPIIITTNEFESSFIAIGTELFRYCSEHDFIKLWDEKWYSYKFATSAPLLSLKKILKSNNITNVAVGWFLKIKKGANEMLFSSFPQEFTNLGSGYYGFLWYEGRYDGEEYLTNCITIFVLETNYITNDKVKDNSIYFEVYDDKVKVMTFYFPTSEPEQVIYLTNDFPF